VVATIGIFFCFLCNEPIRHAPEYMAASLVPLRLRPDEPIEPLQLFVQRAWKKSTHQALLSVAAQVGSESSSG
jgi:hypothetical protein